MFKNREEAAQLLLDKLQKYRGKNVIVAGIPRGAMHMAKIIADGLGAELSAVLVHKIPHPDNPEFAIGSVGISGTIHSNSEFYESYIQEAAKKQLAVLKERQIRYGLGEVNMKGRTVIIVDDGIATGSTTIAAISEVKALGASKVVLAAAVSARDSANLIRPLVDEFVVLDIPAGFYAVGQFFDHFPQVTDEEVEEMFHGESRAHLS